MLNSKSTTELSTQQLHRYQILKLEHSRGMSLEVISR